MLSIILVEPQRNRNVSIYLKGIWAEVFILVLVLSVALTKIDCSTLSTSFHLRSPLLFVSKCKFLEKEASWLHFLPPTLEPGELSGLSSRLFLAA